MTKEEILKQVFETCSFEEITRFGIENNQIENVDILTLAETIEKEGFKVNIFTSDDYCDAISHLLNEASLKCTLPTSYDLMGVIKNHYFNSEIYNCFHDDDMIDHLEGTIAMDNYIEEQCEMRLRDERINCENEAESIIKGHPDTVAKSLQELNSFDLKRFFCDFVDSGYYISNEELLNKLKEKICL
jgi:hypothetical protein